MYISAPQIHNGKDWLPTGTTLEITDDGTIAAILSSPAPGTTYYNNILTPGFVNAHCHLELSHMKGVIPERTGLITFLEKVITSRDQGTEEVKARALDDAYDELERNGTVAIGDIANTTASFGLRTRGQIHFHTFIEALGFSEANAPRSFAFALKAFESFSAQVATKNLARQSITPHAPYSVSQALFSLIDTHTPGSIVSIHNQETEAEDEYYRTKEGPVKGLFGTLGIDDSFFTPSGNSSLQSYLSYMSESHPFLFVHNTFSGREDVQFAKSRLTAPYWCLCPNANLYIEGQLPDIDMLISENANICVGTDSLASNHQLNILSELWTIRQHYPHITWGTLLGWGTYNGAKALQMHDVVGSIEVGKRPGISEISALDGNTMPRVTKIL